MTADSNYPARTAQVISDLDQLFERLGHSRFRSRFRLGPKEVAYLRRRSLETILQHGRQFVNERLAPAEPHNDGRQTPMRGHPIFVAQHATATCCRRCLERWHRIRRGRPLSPEQIDYIVRVLARWLENQDIDLWQPGPGRLFD